MKNILFVASESVPFIKTGGLADVVGSLPKSLDKEKYDVRIFIPKYGCMKQEMKDRLNYKTNFYMDFNWKNVYVGIMEAVVDGITYYFIDNEYYFSGPKPYCDDALFEIEKYAFFSKAVLSSLPLIDFKPDIMHCHDWQTGLIPV
ncbi:MAG: glycogen/starch synthase, partial [Lachnospiraceae bacterium]|nr:glycogen/starch synthase [Lachnospiraceae bacterium]